MSEEPIVKNQAGEDESSDSSDIQRESGVTRRDFLQKSMMVASGLALSSMLPQVFLTEAEAAEIAQAATCPTPGQPLLPIMEIKSSPTTKTLQAVLKMLNEKRSYLAPSSQGGGKTVCQSGQMRFFFAYDPTNPSQKWPTTLGVPNPGPTLRARVGDTVQITLLNQVDVSAFGNTIDVAESGGTCDVAMSVGPDGKAINTYPGVPSFETPPDCFHGSSSANLHFHGTHISPRSIADNVLVNVRPSPRVGGKPLVDEAYVKDDFAKIFAACSAGDPPEQWSDLPPTWQEKQQKLLQDYDKTAPWKGGRGLPPDQQLWLQNEEEMHAGQWPQYYIGAYANCFQIPIWNGQSTSMGQAPGTHWYHGHKHGSTALNLANGMAGALIIEGPYDDTLKTFYTKQQVLVLQQYGAQVNLLKSGVNANKGVNADLVFVNGLFTPVLQMNPNEMQFWRIVNACHQKALPLDPPPGGIKWVQTAQDGVQFDPGTSSSPGNYNPAVTNASFPVPAKAPTPPTVLPSSSGSLAPANRIDLLVLAPSAPGGPYPVTFGGKTLFSVLVKQDSTVPAIPNPMSFPTLAQFPAMPGFLADIDPEDVKVHRELHFASVADKSSPSTARNRGTTPPFAAPKHTIDGKQYDGTIDQTMLLGATEEWTLYNDSPGAAHPFHIHINPFQVIEILNPAISKNPVQLPTPWIWWDNFAIPPAAIPPDGDGKTQVSGYFKMLTRFVDFTGMYVLHCHILGHEDRGMMQLVQVISNTTTMQHK